MRNLRAVWIKYERGIYDDDEVLNKTERILYHTGVMQEGYGAEEFESDNWGEENWCDDCDNWGEGCLCAESFEATKGMDTYAQPLEELKIKPTKTKVGILLASIVAGGLWYSNKMKE